VFNAFRLKIVLLLWLYEMRGSFFAATIVPVFVVSIQLLQQITSYKKLKKQILAVLIVIT
jgi:hypothetical protein